jgi:hypothetical protein
MDTFSLFARGLETLVYLLPALQATLRVTGEIKLGLVGVV